MVRNLGSTLESPGDDWGVVKTPGAWATLPSN